MVASSCRCFYQVLGNSRFNPLHCGAVVASLRSIPRIVIPVNGFNPLHCGAVVASVAPPRRGPRALASFNPLHCGAVVASFSVFLSLFVLFVEFQSPSLRGSGRFSSRASVHGPGSVFQSPSLRGSGRFLGLCTSLGPRQIVSIPFIAGQWSLLLRSLLEQSPSWSFNPLHCGAVVASRARQEAATRERGFNPLHCGAVVASRVDRHSPGVDVRVSIPFIAGQWSLHNEAVTDVETHGKVSIPFIAGQWSLRRCRQER